MTNRPACCCCCCISLILTTVNKAKILEAQLMEEVAWPPACNALAYCVITCRPCDAARAGHLSTTQRAAQLGNGSRHAGRRLT